MRSAIFRDFFSQEVEQAGVKSVLRAVRQDLDMDVAFVARFRRDDRVFEEVDADGAAPLRMGQTVPLERGYCLRVVRGQLPQLIPDTSRLALTREIPETALIPIGAHLSVPVTLSEGFCYGTLCCFSYAPKPRLDKGDLGLLRDLSAVLAAQIEGAAEPVFSRRR